MFYINNLLRYVGGHVASAASITLRGWSVSSAAQSLKLDRKQCTTAAIRWYRSILGNVDADIDFPPRMGNTSGVGSTAHTDR